MKLPLAGGCLCGAVRYEVTESPLTLYACHCTRCQRLSASAFQLSMPVRRQAFRLLQGTPRGWRYEQRPGARSTTWFCADCGVRTHGENASRPAMIVVRAGSLDDTGWLSPVAHIWTGSAQHWLRLDAGTPCFETQPEDATALRAAWQARAAAD